MKVKTIIYSVSEYNEKGVLVRGLFALGFPPLIPIFFFPGLGWNSGEAEKNAQISFLENERDRIERTGKKGKKGRTREKEWKRNLGRRRPEREDGETMRQDSRMGMETQYAMGMGSHACVSSGPAGGGLCSFFPFASFLPLSSPPAVPHSSDRSLSSRCPLRRSVRCQSVNSSFCLRPPPLLGGLVPCLRRASAPNFGVSFK